jgi:hypothetical protein
MGVAMTVIFPVPTLVVASFAKPNSFGKSTKLGKNHKSSGIRPMEIRKIRKGEWAVKCDDLDLELRLRAKNFVDAVEKMNAFANAILREKVTQGALKNQ